MNFIGIAILIVIKIIFIENRMLPINYGTINPNLPEPAPISGGPPLDESIENAHKKVIGLRPLYDEQRETDDYYDYDKKHGNERINKPCAIVVLSNMQNPNMQSLLRKYRYDANGVLIPSSVKYFIKLPGVQSSPVLVPLNDKAFSPLGGFVRYYKEVPPIPHSW